MKFQRALVQITYLPYDLILIQQIVIRRDDWALVSFKLIFKIFLHLSLQQSIFPFLFSLAWVLSSYPVFQSQSALHQYVLISVDNNVVSLHGSYKSIGNAIPCRLQTSSNRVERLMSMRSPTIRMFFLWEHPKVYAWLVLATLVCLYSCGLNGKTSATLDYYLVSLKFVNNQPRKSARSYNWIEIPQIW
jgi:hypothetical protein